MCVCAKERERVTERESKRERARERWGKREREGERQRNRKRPREKFLQTTLELSLKDVCITMKIL